MFCFFCHLALPSVFFFPQPHIEVWARRHSVWCYCNELLSQAPWSNQEEARLFLYLCCTVVNHVRIMAIRVTPLGERQGTYRLFANQLWGKHAHTHFASASFLLFSQFWQSGYHPFLTFASTQMRFTFPNKIKTKKQHTHLFIFWIIKTLLFFFNFFFGALRWEHCFSLLQHVTSDDWIKVFGG